MATTLEQVKANIEEIFDEHYVIVSDVEIHAAGQSVMVSDPDSDQEVRVLSWNSGFSVRFDENTGSQLEVTDMDVEDIIVDVLSHFGLEDGYCQHRDCA